VISFDDSTQLDFTEGDNGQISWETLQLLYCELTYMFPADKVVIKFSYNLKYSFCFKVHLSVTAVERLMIYL